MKKNIIMIMLIVFTFCIYPNGNDLLDDEEDIGRTFVKSISVKSLKMTIVNLEDYQDIKIIELSTEYQRVEIRKVDIKYIDGDLETISDNFIVGGKKESRKISVRKPIKYIGIICSALDSEEEIEIEETKKKGNKMKSKKTKGKGKVKDMLNIYGIME